MRLSLHRHPESAGAEAVIVTVEAERTGADGLELTYRLEGDLSQIVLPPAAAPERTDELWLHSCCEAFVMASAGGYYEFNFAPSSQWAAYHLDGYRSGISTASVTAPRIVSQTRDGGYQLRVELALAGLSGLPPAVPWRLGLSTILEDANGGRSFWALAHPPGKPDFHHPDSFALELAPTDLA
jgi:hypothetical protein